VVLIWTKDGALGSGSLLKDNIILTNRHVVGGEREVTVVFKPSDPSGKAKNDEVVQADVIKLDGQRDLALLRPASIPLPETADELRAIAKILGATSEDIKLGEAAHDRQFNKARLGSAAVLGSVRHRRGTPKELTLSRAPEVFNWLMAFHATPHIT
jgi:hypothetical protein